MKGATKHVTFSELACTHKVKCSMDVGKIGDAVGCSFSGTIVQVEASFTFECIQDPGALLPPEPHADPPSCRLHNLWALHILSTTPPPHKTSAASQRSSVFAPISHLGNWLQRIMLSAFCPISFVTLSACDWGLSEQTRTQTYTCKEYSMTLTFMRMLAQVELMVFGI